MLTLPSSTTTAIAGAGAPIINTGTRTNTRPLAAIAADIHKAERRSIFEIGDLLLEARAACKHGEWLPWLDDEFGWSADTAGRYMKVAELGSKFRKLRNLRLAATILYDLVDEKDEYLPAIIEALAKDAAKKQISRDAAYGIIWRARERHRWGGNYPDATLSALEDLDDRDPWYGDAVAALKTKAPATKEEANAIVASFKPPVGDAADEDVAPADAEMDAGMSAEARKAAYAADEAEAAAAEVTTLSATEAVDEITDAPAAADEVVEAITPVTAPGGNDVDTEQSDEPEDVPLGNAKAAAKAGDIVLYYLDRLIDVAGEHPTWIDTDELGKRLQTKVEAFVELARRARAKQGGGKS